MLKQVPKRKAQLDFSRKMSLFWRATIASARTKTILYVRFLSLTGLGLSFLPPLLNLGTASLNLVIMVVLGTLLGFHLGSLNLSLFAVGLVFMIISLFGLGMIVNAVTLYFRDRTNTANTLTTLILVFSGIVAPLPLLPSWAQAIGSTIPFTYALNLVRQSLIATTSTANYADAVLLIITSLTYLATGYLLLYATVRALRRRALDALFQQDKKRKVTSTAPGLVRTRG